MSSNQGYIVKFIILGDAGAGKTQILIRYSKNSYYDLHHPTVGCELTSMEELVNETKFRVQVWDTAGSEHFRSITRAYFKTSACALLVYDVSNKNSFESVSIWERDLHDSCSEDLVIALIGNKIDLEKGREVSYKEGAQYAKKHKMLFFECSAKTGKGVKEIFQTCLQEIDANIKKKVYRLNDSSCCIKEIAEVEEEKKERIIKNKKKKSIGCC